MIVLSFSCKNDVSKKKEIIAVVDTSEVVKDLEIYDYDGLKPFLNKEDNKTYVINFWATWCAPCVKELPYFEQLNKNFKDKNVEVVLVSLDFPRHYEKKLKPFIIKHNLQSRVIAFDDPDQNKWIPAINKDWSGAIPATIIYNSEERKFYERSFDYEELENELLTILK